MGKSTSSSFIDTITSPIQKVSGSVEFARELERVFYFFQKNKCEARFVGGCVRDIIAGKSIKDIDLATNMPVQEMFDKAKADGFLVIPTGLKYGTVTFVIDRKEIQITTLRKDIKTDGRHAVVSFANSWIEDSSRRDFTFNALYMDINGRIYDYHNGIDDLKNGSIKFIGNSKKRIEEDYLRIFRYFRFWGKYASSFRDNETLEAIFCSSDGIKKISGERIFSELINILSLANRRFIIEQMMRLMESEFKLKHNYLPGPETKNDALQNEDYFQILCCGFDSREDLTFFLKRLAVPKKLYKQCIDIYDFLACPQNLRLVSFFKFSREFREQILRIIENTIPILYAEFKNLQDSIKYEFDIKGKDIIEADAGFPKNKITAAVDLCKDFWIETKAQADKLACLDFFQKNKTEL